MRGRGRPKHPDILTPREWEVLALLRDHRTNDEIAQALGISFTTARFHVSQILGKLGVSSREEAAAWQPTAERRTWLVAPLGLLRRVEGFGAPARVAAGSMLALAAIGIALLAWGVLRTSGRADSPPRTIADAARDAAALVAINQDSGEITVLDPSTLATLGEIQAGYRPWVAVRQSAHQLLVAQAFGPGPAVTSPTLRIYDLDDLSAAPSTIAMPDRAVETLYAPSIELSDDGRYLFYGRIVPAEPGCVGDGVMCQHASVGVIDLEQRVLVRTLPLPSACTYPSLLKTSDGGVLAMCAIEGSETVKLSTVTTDVLSPVAKLPLEDGPSGPRTVREVDAGRDAAGKYYVVFMDAVVRTSEATHPEASFGGDDRISVTDAQLMSGGDRLLPYSTSIGAGQVNGVIVYDERDPSHFRKIPVDGTWSDVTPLTANTVALLRPGEIRILDLDSGDLLAPIVQVPSGEEFIASG
ncbi:MAG TPA: helix-turn-helix transcriptional regulator [Dehalococcoidia bacterium]|nr:helix-turn-helix transcriptional regulator [Dehalococcoidia bacterium]